MPRPYHRLAQYYDELFLSYRAPLDSARERILQRVLPVIRSACDLACGTGTTALMLARRGIRVYAVDLSPQMCRLTREKLQRAKLPARVIHADMRSFRLPQPIDLVLCEFDAINHVPHKADLRKVANAVQRALLPGGYFFFDVNNARCFERFWTGTRWADKPNLGVLMRNNHSPRLDHAWTEIDIFVREGKHWQRHHERVDEVCWSPRQIRKALTEAGFDRIRAWDAASFWKGAPMRRGCRTIYLARKAKNIEGFHRKAGSTSAASLV